MAIVSISKAAKITGKARSTIQSYIRQGKLSKTTDPVSNYEGVDTVELIRVFGYLKNTDDTPAQNDKLIQHTTPYTSPEKDVKIIQLKAEVEKLQAILSAKEKHIESLDNAMRLLEDQRQKKPVQNEELKKEEEVRGFFSRLFKG